MPSRIFVTGGSGFVGSAAIEELLRRRHEVVALVRQRGIGIADSRLSEVRGDVNNDGTIRNALAGCSVAVHLIGIIAEKRSKGVTFRRMHVEATRAVLEAAKAAGVRRYLHMSALGARPGAVSEYHRTKWEAEELVRQSGLEWTIFRPSLIHGPDGEFMRMEAGWARGTKPPFLFMPYFGKGVLGRGGAGRLQPVYVGDVARAFADAIDNPVTVGQTYELGGPSRMTWPEMHRTASRVISGKPRATAALPVWYARLLTRVVPAAVLPFNRDQVTMSQEDNTVTDDGDKFRRDFGWKPREFAESMQEYAERL